VSRAVVKEEGIAHPTGTKGSRGALFCISSASRAIPFNVRVKLVFPNETVWKESGFLYQTVSDTLADISKVTHPRSTAERHMSWITSSATKHSPSERKIMIGVLSCGKALKHYIRKEEARSNYEPFCAPVFFHESPSCPESLCEVCARRRPFGYHSIQELIRGTRKVIDQYVCGLFAK